MWHEFAQAVHLEEKKKAKGFFHPLNKFLVSLPIGVIFLIFSIVVVIAAVMALAPIAKMFGYDLASMFARIQAKYQDKFRPSMWLPFTRARHSAQQKWTSVTGAEGVFKDVVQVIKNIKPKSGESYEIVETNPSDMSIKVHVFSPKMKCLDVVEIKCNVGDDLGGTSVDASSWSSGAGALSLPPPFGFLSSMSLFWLPFSDSGMNKKRLDDIRGALRTDVQLAPGSLKGKSE